MYTSVSRPASAHQPRGATNAYQYMHHSKYEKPMEAHLTANGVTVRASGGAPMMSAIGAQQQSVEDQKMMLTKQLLVNGLLNGVRCKNKIYCHNYHNHIILTIICSSLFGS